MREREPPRSGLGVGSVPRAVHTPCMETRPDFLLLRPIKAAVSPAPDERLNRLQRLERSPDEPDSQRTWIWAQARSRLWTHRGGHCAWTQPGSNASPALQRPRNLFWLSRSHFPGRRKHRFFPCPDCNHLGPEFADHHDHMITFLVRSADHFRPTTASFDRANA